MRRTYGVRTDVDGVQDRPPGRTAENWSRNDRIRAGAVSGPWRSAPRAETPVVTAQAPAPPATPRSPTAAPRLDARAAPTPVQPRPVAVRPATGQSRTSPRAMIAWIAFGLAFAGLCVGLAFVFQPSGTPSESQGAAPTAASGIESAPAETTGAAPEASVTAGEAGTAPLPGPGALAGVTNVRLRTGTGLADTVRDAVTAALGKAGLSDVQVESLPFAVATSRVGYYRPEDRALAEALAAYVGPVLGYDGPLAVRDYGQLLDNAEPGRLDLWIGGASQG